MKPSPAQLLFLLLRLGLGVVFLWAGVMKIYDFAHGGSATQDFWQDIMNYQLVSTDFAKLSAIYLPWLEVTIGLAFVLRRGLAGASMIAAVLMAIFLAALLSAWKRRLDISCGCFGHENATADFPLLLARDLVLLGGALLLAWRELRPPNLHGTQSNTGA